MARYRKKPVEIEAVQFTRAKGYEAMRFLDEHQVTYGKEMAAGDIPVLVIPTLEGNMCAAPGDYIIRGVRGEFYPCKPDIFEATYEAL